MKYKNILIIGAGGIGSWIVEEICDLIKHKQIDPMIQLTVADNDNVELNQINFQNFTFKEAGMNKAKALATRLRNFGIGARTYRVNSEAQLIGFDLIILCVDNDPTRHLVINSCFEEGIDFIDLRARGNHITAIPKMQNKESNLKFIDEADTTSYSCQDAASKASGQFSRGNKIIAIIGAQMLLNYLRGQKSKVISLSL